MIVKINNTTVTITGNPTLERNVKEELDTAKIEVVSTRETRYEMYDKVDITTPYEDTEQYLVQADNVVQLKANTYQHNLTLFENIAFLNTIYPADRSFKVVGQTLEDILTAYQRELSTYHNIDIDWSTMTTAELAETIPFKEFAGLNLSSILLSLFRKIWAVPKVNRDGNTWDIYPLYHSERNNSITSSSSSKMSNQNNVDYATKVKSQLKNAVNERTVGEVTWFPSASGYVLPRSSSLEKISQKLRYELDSGIITILSAEVVGVSCEIYNIDTTSNEYPTGITIDIADRIIQDEAWDLKATTSSVSQLIIQNTDNCKNYIRYKVGQPYITNLYELGSDGIIFSSNTRYLINAIERAILLDYNLTGNYQDVVLDQDTDEIQLRVKYVRQRNIDLIHNRKTNGVMNSTTTIHQQRDASVEVNEYKKNLKIYSNRMGNNEFSKTKMFTYPDEPYELFDYTDDKTIVTRVQNTYHNKFVYCEYEESVDFSNIEAEYALMRRSDPYTINAKAVTTNLIYQEYIEFSTTAKTVDSRLEDEAKQLLTGLLTPSTVSYEKVAVGVFRPKLTSWNSTYAIHMPVEASGDGNLITVHVQFPHQTIAGKTYYDLDADTLTAYLNPLPYTDEDGRLEDFYLYFTPDVVFEDTGEYPLILDQTNYLANNYTTIGLDDPLDLDTAASFAETMQISFIADENIYIGNSMARDNYFVNDQVLPPAPIKLYTSTKPYGQYDQAPRTSDTDNTANITYNYSFANRTITITPSIAVDYLSIVRNDKILLAINQSIAAGETVVIYMNFTKIISISFALKASATDLSSLSGTASIEYTIRLIQANATSLSDLSGTSSIAYTERDFALEANTTSLSNITGTASITFTSIDYVLEANVIDLSNITGTAIITYSTVVYDLEANASGLSSLSGSADLAYNPEPLTVTFINDGSTYDEQTVDYGDDADTPTPDPTKATDSTYDYTFDSWDTDYTNVTEDLTVTAVYNATVRTDVSWQEVTSGTPTTNQCINIYDVGNIKEEASCTFTGGTAYQSSTSLTTPIPPCSDGATYTLCVKISSVPLLFSCVDYEGVEGTPVLYECQID